MLILVRLSVDRTMRNIEGRKEYINYLILFSYNRIIDQFGLDKILIDESLTTFFYL
jgi:hypothetical protein